MSEELSKQYSPNDVETRWYAEWERLGIFHAEVNPKQTPYTIVIPPPNVTGILTMGHILNNTIQDVFIRYERMLGREACWVPGTDHAGIATQTVVEKKLREKKIFRHDLGREKFVEKVWEWKEEYGGIIIKQLRKLGVSCDWRREAFTMNETLSRAVNEVFVRLYEKGLIYRGKRIINWSPAAQSALSDEEVNYKETNGKLYYIKYPLADKTDFLTIATTRPETMLGDTAVAVNPNDERYKHLIGKNIELPLTGRTIPIIADDYVDPAFGTGAVKVTPAHDPNDFEIGKRHNLPQLLIMDMRGVINENGGGYEGLDRFVARKAIVGDLTALELVEKIEEYKHSVGYSERGGEVIEPYLSDQWFVKMEPLAKPALDAVERGEIHFHPEHWVSTYRHWMTNIRDWCISRQLWWGHRIPAYYKEDGTIVVARTREEAERVAGTKNLRQDEDVLDTWFSSWLWPLSVFGWPEETDDLKYFYPTDTLVTGPDIIFFWVARMIMAGLEFRGEVPFRDVYFTSIIRDEKGRKMSKSLGNSPDPLDVIRDYGADALRFTVIYLAPLGQDILFSTEKCELGRNFANKLWNAGRFLLLKKNDAPENTGELKFFDKWILSRYHSIILEARRALDTFNINEYTKIIYDFIWHDYCDWYLEMSKQNPGSIHVALEVFEGILRMTHPVMPFVTEELWHAITGTKESSSISTQEFPSATEKKIDETLERVTILFQQAVEQARMLRSEMKVPAAERRKLFVYSQDEIGKLLHDDTSKTVFETLATVDLVMVKTEKDFPSGLSATAVVSATTLKLILDSKEDIDRERLRISKEIDRLASQREGVAKKLSNEAFVGKAPKDVIDREQAKAKDYSLAIEKLSESLKQLQ